MPQSNFSHHCCDATHGRASITLHEKAQGSITRIDDRFDNYSLSLAIPSTNDRLCRLALDNLLLITRVAR